MAARARLKEKQKLMDKFARRKEVQAVREKNPKASDRQDGCHRRASRRPIRTPRR